MTEKELSPEEQRAKIVKNTLEYELLQNVVGGNAVKQNPFLYGQLGLSGGEQTYADALKGDYANKLRAEIYDERQKQRKSMGIAEEPQYTSNYDVVARLKQQLGEVQSMAKLSELEEAAKSVGAENVKVPDKLKDYSEDKIIGKYVENGRVDLSKLTEEEKDALKLKGILIEAYERALGVRAAKSNYYSDLSEACEKICEKYSKKETN
ncbi:MAG: hypothetical protein ABH804_01360 [archaeon]